MIGNVASNAAVCIAVAASRPGRQEREVGHAAERRVRADAIDVAAEPEAHRRQEQDRRQERGEDRLARNVRRY